MGFLATKQGEGGRGIENTAKSASQRGSWAVYWFGYFFIFFIMVFSVLFAYMSHRVTHGAPYSGGEIAPFAWQGQWLLLRIICHLQHHHGHPDEKARPNWSNLFFSEKESMFGLNWLTPKPIGPNWIANPKVIFYGYRPIVLVSLKVWIWIWNCGEENLHWRPSWQHECVR